MPKCIPHPEFHFLGELKNLCVKISLLQAIKDVPVYTKGVRELCIKIHGRNPRDPPTVKVLGKLSKLMSGKIIPTKYDNPGNPAVL
jgi:hypothetical protein